MQSITKVPVDLKRARRDDGIDFKEVRAFVVFVANERNGLSFDLSKVVEENLGRLVIDVTFRVLEGP